MYENSDAYLTQDVEFASPARLTELLFQRAVRDLDGAREAWPHLRTSPTAIRLTVHAQSIVRELQSSLNMSAGGMLAVELWRVYEFMLYQMMQVCESRTPEDVQKLVEVQELLESLGDAWSTMMRQQAEAGTASSLVQGEVLVA